MFNCRVCSNAPFAAFFGGGGANKDGKKERPDDGDRRSSDGGSTGYGDDDRSDAGEFSARTMGETVTQVNLWLDMVHDRVKKMWTESELRDLLAQVAEGVSKHDDPVEGQDDVCSIWHGKYSANGAPILDTKTNAGKKSQIYVTRALVFMFADDSSFAELQPTPSQPATHPFQMACEDKRCVQVSHIALPDEG